MYLLVCCNCFKNIFCDLFQLKILETEREQYKNCCEPIKKKLRLAKDTESGLRISLEKARRDSQMLSDQNVCLHNELQRKELETKKSEMAFKDLDSKFKVMLIFYSFLFKGEIE